MAAMPAPGGPAPDFEAPTQSGEALRLSRLRGRPVALYVYPKDATPGCTTQVCNLRDHVGALAAAGVAVVGVSADPVESRKRSADEHGLPFPLVADPDREIPEAYGVWGERSFSDKTAVGTRRTTVLVGPDGTVLHVFKRPKTKRHAEEILAKLAALAPE